MSAHPARLVMAGALAAAVAVSAVAATTSAALTGAPVSYRDFRFGSAFEATADKPQSKVWYQAGAWWALLLRPANKTVHIFELLPDHTWRDTGTQVDNRTQSTADTLWDGSHLYVVSRNATGSIRVSRLSYVPASRTYTLDAGFPTTIATGGSETATIAKDGLGLLWVTFTQSSRVYVLHSLAGADNRWTAPFTPPVAGTSVTSDDISAVVQMRGAIGVMWSNQNLGSFLFAVHNDGSPDTAWTEEVADNGKLHADDHIDLRTLATGADGRVFAAVKTSMNDSASNPPSSPYVEVLIRTGTSQWQVAPVTQIKDDTTRPVLSIDTTSGLLYVFFTANARARNGSIHYKTSPLSAVSFDATSIGPTFLSWAGADINDASTSKDPMNGTSGAVVIASDQYSATYYHAELGTTAAVTADTTNPTAPTRVTATATNDTVALSWAPAADDRGVTGYDVYRNGRLVATTASPTYTDRTARPGHLDTYRVDAYDASGNTSPSKRSTLSRTRGVVVR